MLQVLNVAEKPSVAKEISRILTNGQYRNGRTLSRFNPVHQFNYTLQQQQQQERQCAMLFTSVRGHLMSLDFFGEYKSWHRTAPEELYSAPVKKALSEDSKDLRENLVACAKKCQWLVLWLDCDREGENIAFEVQFVCKSVNPRLHVLRATFSALTKSELEHACRSLHLPDQNQSDAVDARCEIDLRIGASFTRFLTLRWRKKVQLPVNTVSYGPCQSPTLGFVVARHAEATDFVREPFWSIKVYIKKKSLKDEEKDEKEEVEVEFLWDRVRLFDRLCVMVLYELCLENPVARITNLRGSPVTKRRPLPLCTVELHKMANRKLRMSSAHCMSLAEKLYQKGIISYPRTETEVFASSMNLRELLAFHIDSPLWGAYTQKLLNGEFQWPCEGSRDDKAHPPIHPLKLVNRADLDNDDEWKLYEYVTRHFLACCSDDAIGFETYVALELAGEAFHTSGLVVLDRRWLEVFPYEQWSGRKLPHFLCGEEILPSAILMTEGHTEPPALLTEADLIDLMDKNGIGTDATMHDHIKTIQDRQYAYKSETNHFIPTPLGIALYQGMKQLAVVSGVDLSLPDVRARMEADISLVAAGRKAKEEVLQCHLSQMKRVFLLLKNNAAALDREILTRLPMLEHAENDCEILYAAFSECGRCQAPMNLIASKSSTASLHRQGDSQRRGQSQNSSADSGITGRDLPERFLVCTRYNEGCLTRLLLPRMGEFSPQPTRCTYCRFQALTLENTRTGECHELCPFCFRNPTLLTSCTH